MFFVGVAVGFLLLFLIQHYRLRAFRDIAKAIMKQAERQAEQTIQESRTKAAQIEAEARSAVAKTTQLSSTLKTKEDKIEREKEKLQHKASELDKTESLLNQQMLALQARALELENQAGLTRHEAKELLLEQVRKEAEQETLSFLLTRHQKDLQEADHKALHLLLDALGRLPKKELHEHFIEEVLLPNEEMKAKIIGREGKNIKAFQKQTGVSVVIDETPLVVFLSSFDAARREIAKKALQALIDDGQINPIKIEEAVLQATNKFDESLLQYGLEAAQRAEVHRLHPELLKILGKLQLLSSHGQNLLDHSVEVSQIMAMLAAELKLDAAKAKRIGLLHDIGKALTCQTALTHATAGAETALAWGESEEVANGIACHHNEVQPMTMEAMLCKPADHFSAALLGARQENSEHFYKRLHTYEAIAKEFPGVETAFALQAGKELMVFVKPDEVSDEQAVLLAKEIAHAIEKKTQQGRRVQITVIRQTQSVEYIV